MYIRIVQIVLFRSLIVIGIALLPICAFAQRDVAGYYADESERSSFLELRCDGSYVFTMSARCMAPPYIDSGKYEVRGDTVFISPIKKDSIQGNLLIITRIPVNDDAWFWDIGMLVDIHYDSKYIPKNMVGRLGDHMCLSGFGFKRKWKN